MPDNEPVKRVLRVDYDDADPEDLDGDDDGLLDAFEQMMVILRARPKTHYIECSTKGGTLYCRMAQSRKDFATGPWEFCNINIIVNPMVSSWEQFEGSITGRIYLFMRWGGDDLVSPELVGIVHPYTHCPRIAS